MVEVALQIGGLFDPRAHVRLTHEPSDEALGCRMILSHARYMAGTKSGRELRLGQTHRMKPLLEQIADGCCDGFFIAPRHLPFGDDLVFEVEEPAIDQRSKCSRAPLLRLQPFDRSTVDGLHSIERRLRLRDLDQRRREAALERAMLEPPGKKRLPSTVLTAHGLEAALAG